MVQSRAEAQAELEGAQRRERVAKAFAEQGKEERAARLRTQAAAQRAPAQNRLTQLNPSPALLSSDQISNIGGSSDRELTVALLRAQAQKARELEQQERAQERLSRDDKRDITRYQTIARESDRIAAELEKITGSVPESYELQIGRARFPDMKTTELRVRYGTRAQQIRALNALRSQRAIDQEIAAQGFEGSRSEFLAQERARAAAVNREAVVEQRLRFLASGESKTATPAQVKAAQRELETKGVQVFTRLTVGGKTFERGSGAAELPGRVIGIGSVSAQEQRAREKTRRVEQTRLAAGIQQDRRGNTILVRGGPRNPQTVKDLFKELGAPETQVSIRREGEEVSRKITLSETIYTIPNAATARFGGFPTEQDGKPIAFPAQFKVTTEESEEFPRRTIFTPVLEKIVAIDTKGKELAGLPRVPLEGPGRAEFLQKPAGERLKLTVEDFGGRIVSRIQTAGETAQKAGGAIERFGEGTLQRFPLVKQEERDSVKALPGAGAQVRAAGALLVREVPSRVGFTVRNVGQFVTEEGRIAQESPVTFGVGEAVLIGSVFGTASKIIELAKVSKLARSATVAGRVVLGAARAAEATEVAVGVGLTGAYVIQTAHEVQTAERPGAALARASNQLAGFVVGARAGSGGVQAVADVKTNIQSGITIYRLEQRLKGQLVTRDTARELARVSKEVGLEVAVRPVEARVTVREAQERAGIKVEESAQREVLGESRLVRPEELLRPDDYVLVTSVRRVRQGTLQENIGPQNVESGTGLPSRAGSLVTERFSGERRAATVREALPPINEQVNIVRTSRSDLTIGWRRATQDIRIERFDPLQLSGDTRIVPTAKAKGRGAGLRRVSYEAPRIGTLRVESVQLEALRPFSEAQGDFFVLNPKTGEFALSRQTEFRRFQRGTQGIPGRRSITEGKLPGAVETNLNLPRELAREFAKTPGGQAYLVERGVFRIEKIKKAKPKPKKGGSSSTTLSDEVEVESGAQVLLRKRATRIQARQETKQEKRQETKLEQEVAGQRQETVQEARQEARREGAQSSFTRNRFAAVGLRVTATTALSAALAKSASALRLRAAPSLSTAQSSLQRLESMSLQDQAQRQQQRQETLQESATLQETKQEKRQETKLEQEVAGQRQETLVEQVQQARGRGGLRQALTEVTELRLPKAGGLLSKEAGSGVPGFQVFVRKGGKFKLASTRVLSREQALELGANIADASPVQTFKLLEANVKAEGGREPSKSRLDSLLSKFRVTKAGAFREKQEFLIDTPGELQGITLKGVRASAQSRKQLGKFGL